MFNYITHHSPEFSAYFYSPFRRKGLVSKIKYIITFSPTYFRAKYIVGSHPPKDFFPFSWSNRKLFVDTWHGTPLKAMFFADKGDTESSLRGILRLNKKTTFFIVSSKLEAELIERCFRIGYRKIIFTGHPRNDLLLTNVKHILPKILEKAPKFKKVILYCPTYRRDTQTIFFPFKDFDKNDFNNFLKKHELLILVREHIYSKCSEVFFSERIIPFGFDIFSDINAILPEVDVLITDYSSIYIDYLLVNKPCIFIPYDLANYSKKRGFLLDYNLWTPGPKISNYFLFKEALEDALCDDCYNEKRVALKEKFHSFQTMNSSEKIIQFLKDKVK